MTNDTAAETIEVRTTGELNRALDQLREQVQHCPILFEGTTCNYDVRFGVTNLVAGEGGLAFMISAPEARMLAIRNLPEELHFLLEQDGLKKWFDAAIDSGNRELYLAPEGRGHLRALRRVAIQALVMIPLSVWDPITRRLEPMSRARVIAGRGLVLTLPEAVRDHIVEAVPRRFNALMAGF